MRKVSLIGIAGLAGAIFGFALASPPADAQTIDPQIFVQQSGTSPAGGDPNLITNTNAFVVGVAGNFTLQNPLLIITGNYDSTATPSISFSGGVSSATIGTYGLTATSATFTAASGGTAYSLLGLAAGGSDSFGNWSAGDVANGFAAPTKFGLSVFALNGNLTSGTPFTIDESGLAPGSYIIAYSCENGTGSSSGCATSGNIGQTPFTDAGLIDGRNVPVPEPGSLALFGTALASFGLLGWFRRRA
jgi:hypothetical protein